MPWITPLPRSFTSLLDPLPVPTLALCGIATPRKSKAEMADLAHRPQIDLRWVTGALGLHEECAEAVADPIASFLNSISGEA
jgi:hypothetical protein